MSPLKLTSLWLGGLLRASLGGGSEDRFSRGEVVSTMDSWELFRRRVIPKQLRILVFRFGKSPQLRAAHSLVINGYVTTAGSKLWPKNGGVLEQEISTGSNQEHLSLHVLNTKCRL